MTRNIFILLTILMVQALSGCASEAVQREQPEPVRVEKAETAPFSGYMYNCREAGDYGMYSYLVMAYPGNSQNFIETIRVFLEKTSKLNQQNKSVDEHLLNNVFIPLWSSPPAWVRDVDIENDEQLDATARWIAQNYDHKCARLIMRNIPESGRNSIYIVSSLTGLTTNGKPSIVMIQEVNNGIEPSRFDLVNEFFKKTWHQRYWTEQSVKDVAKLLSLAVEGNDLADQLDVPISDYLTESEPEQATVEAQQNREPHAENASSSQAEAMDKKSVSKKQDARQEPPEIANEKKVVITRPIDDVPLPVKGIITVVLPN